MSEIESADSTENQQILKVKARTAENVQIKYPLYVYAFDQDGSCKATQTIGSSKDSLGLTLVAGDYRVVVISDVSESYKLPETPNSLEEISLVGNQGAITPMMMGKADVTIGKKDASLDIALTYVVTAVSVALKGISSDVAEVKLTLSPMYGSITMNGDYAGENQKLVIPCKLNTDNIWYANNIYAFPGCGEETVFSILLTFKDGTQTTYAYTYQGVPEANHPFNISGNYKGSVTVGGEFIVNGWDTPINVEFDFGLTPSGDDDSQEPDKDPDEEPEETTELSAIPQVGDIIDRCIVSDIVESDDKNVTLLLMDTDEWEGYAADVYDALENAGNDWRLPDEAEAHILNQAFRDDSLDALNERLAANGFDTITTERRYLYDNEGEIFAFGFKASSKFQVAGAKTKYLVRFVKTRKYALK